MKLHEQVKHQQKIIQEYKNTIVELQSYIDLPKYFWPNNSVSVDDIRLRLRELEQMLFELGDI